MLYLIGGIPRSGKSRLKDLFLKKYNIPGISTDHLREALISAYPQLGIKKEAVDTEKDPILWPYFEKLINIFISRDIDFVLEGVNFPPSKLVKYRDTPNVKVCFIGYGKIDIKTKFEEMRKFSHKREWTHKVSDERLIKLINYNKKRSIQIEEECKKYNLKYFDNSFEDKYSLEKILDELIALDELITDSLCFYADEDRRRADDDYRRYLDTLREQAERLCHPRLWAHD